MFFQLSTYLIGAAVLFVFSAIKVLREYERGVIFLLGRFWKVKGPGLIIVIPGIQKMIRVDLRTVVMDVPTQDVISRDNVSVKVSAVIYFRILDPERAIIQVENRVEATSQLAQTTLRSVLGRHELDDMLAEREKLNADVQEILDQNTEGVGHQGDQRRNQTCGSRREHDSGDRRAGRGGTGAAREDHSRRRRTAGIEEARGGGQNAFLRVPGPTAPLSADADRDIQRAEYQHHCFPVADGLGETDLRQARSARLTGEAGWRPITGSGRRGRAVAVGPAPAAGQGLGQYPPGAGRYRCARQAERFAGAARDRM